MAMTDVFNLYVNDATAVSNYCGTFQLNSSASQVTYTPGGVCTAGSGDSIQTIPVTDAGASLTGGPITLAGVLYNSFSIFFDQTLWRITLNPGDAEKSAIAIELMAFPYASNYVFLVYQTGGRNHQLNH